MCGDLSVLHKSHEFRKEERKRAEYGERSCTRESLLPEFPQIEVEAAAAAAATRAMDEEQAEQLQTNGERETRIRNHAAGVLDVNANNASQAAPPHPPPAEQLPTAATAAENKEKSASSTLAGTAASASSSSSHSAAQASLDAPRPGAGLVDAVSATSASSASSTTCNKRPARAERERTEDVEQQMLKPQNVVVEEDINLEAGAIQAAPPRPPAAAVDLSQRTKQKSGGDHHVEHDSASTAVLAQINIKPAPAAACSSECPQPDGQDLPRGTKSVAQEQSELAQAAETAAAKRRRKEPTTSTGINLNKETSSTTTSNISATGWKNFQREMRSKNFTGAGSSSSSSSAAGIELLLFSTC